VILNELFSIGIHAVTMGNHTWSKKEIFNFVESEPRMIRPFNVSPFWPGNGTGFPAQNRLFW
jgi:calcineurin-like phosphoesterase